MDISKLRVFLFTILLASGCIAQSAFGQHANTITIELQEKPNAMEPKDEPVRIRVNDRSHVRVIIRNLSPLDVCSLGNRTSTPVAETNPFEALIQTVSGLSAFSLAGSTGVSTAFLLAPGRTTTSADFEQFNTLAAQFRSKVQATVEQQIAWRTDLEKDARSIVAYSNGKYRGADWRNFDPANAEVDGMREVRVHSDPRWPLLVGDQSSAFADAQELYDQLVELGTRIQKDKNASDAVLKSVAKALSQAKAISTTLSDNNTALRTAQTALRASYVALIQAHASFNRLLIQGIIQQDDSVLTQEFVLGTDHNTTVTGTVSCVSSIDSKPTTDQIPYTVLYENVPQLTASIGLLTTFQRKTVIGIANNAAANSSVTQTFAITDSARAQVFPVAYVNWRTAPALRVHRPFSREDELNITTSLSTGFGLNPNSGTTQPEFFLGAAFGFNKLMIHPGVHFGRTESLGGGFTLGSQVPSSFTGAVPLAWHYHAAFSIGFSVRTAPW